MSSRIVPRFALTALFVAALAAPAVAQETLPQAPMPRAKAQNQIEISLKWTFGSPPVVAPMCPPEAPVVAAEWQNPSEIHASSPFVCEDLTIRVPKPTAFVIGLGGLQRVMPLPEPPRFLVPATPVPNGSFAIGADGHCASATFADIVKVVRETRTGSFPIGGCVNSQPLPVVPPPARGLVTVAYDVCPPCPLPVTVNPLSGTWYRDMGLALVAVTFVGDEMTVRMTQRDGERIVVMTLTAHCTVAKDGLVYGAVTSADVDLKGDAKDMELAELSLMVQELTDRPFSFRTKMTSVGLMVSQLKAASFEGVSGKELMVLGGLYKHAKDGKVPELKPVKAAVGRCEVGISATDAVIAAPVPPHCSTLGAAVGSAIGSATGALIGASCDKVAAPQVERIGIDFNVPPAPPVMHAPVAPTAMPLEKVGFRTVGPACEPVAADAMKQMAVEAFQQMLRPIRVEPQAWYGGMTLPSPRYLEHYPQYFPPDPAFPLPRELAAQEPCPERYKNVTVQTVVTTSGAKPGPVGTWVRDVGAKRCVVKIAPDHFTATVSEAHEVNGKTVTGHLTFTVDYHLARDGITAVGLLTSVDAKVDGDLPDDTQSMFQQVGDLQKLLEDKPLALTFRVYGDALVIGNVRMQSVNGLLEAEPHAYIGGRYKSAGDKPLPALKAVKHTEKPMPYYSGPATFAPPGGFGPPVACPPGVYSVPVFPPGACLPPPGLPAGSGSQGFLIPASYADPANVPLGDLLPPESLPRPAPPRPAPAPKPPVALPPIPRSETNATVPAVPATQTVAIPDPVPSMTPPPTPVPTMPQPTAPVVVEVKAGNKYAGDPNERMKQLLQQSKDLRQIQSEWRKFWFPDKPDHLTPERIHGGIY